MKKFQSFKMYLKNLPKRYLWVGGCLLVVLVAMLVLKSTDNDEQKVKQAEEELVVLIDHIRQHYRNRPDAWGLNTEVAIKNQLVLEKMIKENRIFNAFGQEVLVGSNVNGNMVMPGQRNFVIVYKNLNYNRCVKMAANLLSDKLQLGLNSMTIVNEVQTTFQWGAENALPISANSAKKTCKKENAILWDINL